jgi:hypothetical protein
VSRLAISPTLHIASAQLVTMGSPFLNMDRAFCAAPSSRACRARSGGVSMVMPTSGRPVIAVMSPTSVTRTRPRDHQAKSPRHGAWGFLLASTIHQGYAVTQWRCNWGLTGVLSSVPQEFFQCCSEHVNPIIQQTLVKNNCIVVKSCYKRIVFNRE